MALSESMGEVVNIGKPQIEGSVKAVKGLVAPAVLEQWVKDAEPGEWLEYYRGLLGRDCGEDAPKKPPPTERQLLLRAVRRMAWRLAKNKRNLVILVQKRYGPCDFSYRLLAIDQPLAKKLDYLNANG